MKNLLTAFEENRRQRIDILRIFDNSKNFGRPRLVLAVLPGIWVRMFRFRRGSKPHLRRQASTSETCAERCAAGAGPMKAVSKFPEKSFVFCRTPIPPV